MGVSRTSTMLTNFDHVVCQQILRYRCDSFVQPLVFSMLTCVPSGIKICNLLLSYMYNPAKPNPNARADSQTPTQKSDGYIELTTSRLDTNPIRKQGCFYCVWRGTSKEQCYSANRYNKYSTWQTSRIIANRGHPRWGQFLSSLWNFPYYSLVEILALHNLFCFWLNS